MKKGLLVIDVQNYFAVEKAAELPQKIAGYIRSSSYDEILFTKFRNAEGSNFRTILEYDEVAEAPATDIHPLIEEFANKDNTFEKTTYSAMKAPGLIKRLEESGIQEIDICGISMDACILATGFDAFDLGYKVAILDNLCSVSSVREDLQDAAKVVINRNLRKHARIPRKEG